MVNLNIIIFICMIAPMSFLLLVLNKKSKTLFTFLIIGIFISFFSAEVSGFIIKCLNFDFSFVVVNITPVIEEVLKLSPLIFYALNFPSSKQELLEYSIALGLGFATYENIYYIAATEDLSLFFALIRGFCSGPLHCLCTLIAGYFLNTIKTNKKFFFAGSFSLLSLTIIIHGIYNLMIQSQNMILGAIIPASLFFVFYFLFIKSGRHLSVINIGKN